MRIQVLGTGCAKCRALAERAEEAARSLGLDCEIEKVEDLGEIIRFGVMATPALVVDGEVKAEGALPDIETLKGLLA